MPGLIASEIDGDVGRLRLTRPEKHNALNQELVDQAVAAMDEYAAAGVRVAVLEAAPPTFCAGNDLTEARAGMDGAASDRFLAELLERPLFWIAVVSGPALGAGAAVAAACPVTLATDQAWFALPESGLGLFPARALRYIEPFVGPRLAVELGLSARRLGPEEARAAGIVNEVVPVSELNGAVARWVAHATAHPAVTTAARESWQELFRTDAAVQRAAQLERIFAAQELDPVPAQDGRR